MALNHIAILGNSLESRLTALCVKLAEPDMEVKIYTNGQDYSMNILRPVGNPLCAQGLKFLHDYCGISKDVFWTRTNSTVAMGEAFQHNKQDGSTENVYLPLQGSHFPNRLVHYQCTVKDFHPDLNENEQFRLFLEYILMKYPNSKNAITDTLTWFAPDKYHADKHLEHFFNLENSIIASAPDADDFQVAEGMPICYDFDSIKSLMDEKITSLNIPIITDTIQSITVDHTPSPYLGDNMVYDPELDEYVSEDQANILRDEYDSSLNTLGNVFGEDVYGEGGLGYKASNALGKDYKNITKITIGGTEFDVDFVVDCGCTHSQVEDFIETDGPKTSINETFPWTQYKEYESSRHHMQCHTLFYSDGIPNGARCHEVYRNKTIHKEFQLVDAPVDGVTGLHASKYLAGAKGDITTVSLSGRNVQDNHLINDKFNSNYVKFDLKGQALNPAMNEDSVNLFRYAYMIQKKISNIHKDPRNLPIYLGSIQSVWYANRNAFKRMAYYVWDNNTIGPAWEWANNVPTFFQNLFDSWNGGLPRLPGIVDYSGQSFSSTFITKDYINEGRMPGLAGYGGYMDREWAYVAEARGKVTQDFSSKFTGKHSDVFEDLRLLSILLKYKFYEFGSLTFEEFRSRHLVGDDSLNPITGNHIVLEDGTGKLLTKHRYIQMKEYATSEDSSI